MSLREDLARRLYAAAFWAGETNGVANKAAEIALSSPHNESHYGKIADECIRQMEWARRRCGSKDMDKGFRVEPSPELVERAKTDRSVYTLPYYDYPYVTLTLAPDDWKP